MHVTLVHVQVKPERVQDFIEATRKNHEGSVREPGNLRFDVLQVADDPTHFLLYEAYRSAEDATAHKRTAHYATWAEAVTEWLARPRERASYKGLFPEFD
jgi:(4S)-4-hydroxy-5-phosphonooxypentane-2,3-dione isomerase